MMTTIADSPEKPSFLITVDVEDWFQVENFKSCIPFSSWDSFELRVERNVHRILDLLEGIPLKDAAPAPGHPKATFFVLGWVAERLPHLVREIHQRGHEIASHGNSHVLCREIERQNLRQDLAESKRKPEGLTEKRWTD